MNQPKAFLAVCIGLSLSWYLYGDVGVEGTFRKWHTVTLHIQGPSAHVSDDRPNPFLDYRLQARFVGPGGRQYSVPGFFDGDGEGGRTGRVWRVRFTPDAAGDWTYRISFRQGSEVAVSLAPEAGSPLPPDGAEGRFTVNETNPNAPGFLKWGRLEYVGKHYLKFREGPYWIRGGTDSPENFLAYKGFDNTLASPDDRFPIHTYADHLEEWRPGDPDWGNGRGKPIIGALNYLASRHVNSLYFMPMNIGGDGKDVWPFIGKPDPSGSPMNDNLHYDVGKLAQWELVFAHAQRQGIFLHWALNEAEEPNKRELDNGELGAERKLYYREMIARFAHHLALQWNLCEEYNLRFNLGAERVRQFAHYIQAVDPYDHPITVHSAGDPMEALGFTIGDDRFSMTSIQIGWRRIDTVVENFRRATAAAGRPLPVSMDEFTVDGGQERGHLPVNDPEKHRREKLWPAYLSGGMVEIILEDLLATDSFRTAALEAIWTYMWYARKFLETLPFWEMEPADSLVEGASTLRAGLGNGRTFELGAQVFAKPGEVYAIYFPSAQETGRLNLSRASGRFDVQWYNPRTGQFAGSKVAVQGGAEIKLGSPPENQQEDWVALLRKN